nr:unnamed protein product [Digitaria exilis]
MERQRSPASSSSSYHCHLLSPRSLPLVSVASLSLLFTLILALRHGLPLHHPLAFATAPAPVFVGGGAYWGDPSAAEVEEAVLGLGRGDSVAEGARPAVAGDLSVQGVGSATETQETASGVGDGGAPSNGDVLKGQEVGEARNHSHGGLDSSVEVKKAAPQGRAKEPAKDLVSDMADASAEKLEGTGSLRDVDFSMEASGPAMGARDELLQGGHAEDGRNSSVHRDYASQHGEHRDSSGNSTVRHSPGAALDNPDKQETAKSNRDLARSNAGQCDDVSDGSWVFDESYPLYESNSCPFIDEGFNCQANGRMDQSYMKMRWQPKNCNVPRCLLH